MSYLDSSDAQLISLTRTRRAERRVIRDAVRETHEALSFPAILKNTQDQIEAAWRVFDALERRPHPPHVMWKIEQWALGNRKCGYCGIHMIRTSNSPRSCTVDHRKPRALGGHDVKDNWLLACLDCNTRKGMMLESDFRKSLAIMIFSVR